MDASGGGRNGGSNGTGRRILNMHVHLPPNFSAFETVEDAVTAAAAEGVLVLGGSNFHDHRVYARFGAAAEAAGIVPLFGREFITLAEDLRELGIKVNDPDNAGRFYVCGKGINAFADLTPTAAALTHKAQAVDALRMRTMVPLLLDRFAKVGLRPGLTVETIAHDVAARAGVPREWVVLQERHVAQAFQQAVFDAVEPERRAHVLDTAFGGPAGADVEDSNAVTGEIRSRLMKAGRPAFVPESPVPFEDAYRLVLEIGGIPCYPTVADGATPVSQWEDGPVELADRILERNIFAAELITNRNSPAAVEAYTRAWRDAGIIVTSGTEHNTRQRIPLEPLCADRSPLTDAAWNVMWEGTCVIAAHQHLRARGEPGFVDGEGRPNPGFPDAETRIRWFAELGAELVRAAEARVPA
jgi:hypothetical protein